tara:strand:+ start:224 stop:535 length:312 start_codon:yes stop_codon:yes gene_type:complete
MSLYSDNFWAEEMGLDLSELIKERPNHPTQLHLKIKVTKQAEDYWRRERYLAQIKNHIPKALIETVEEKHNPKIKKATKIRKYEFTEKQLQIALRVLDGNDSM